jgi:hypothetical protein
MKKGEFDMKTRIKMKDLFKRMKPGYMNAVVQHSNTTNKTETVFIIKDYEYKLKYLLESSYVDIRGSLEYNSKAIGFIYLVKFGESKKRIYHHWFDKTIQKNDLFHLLQQEKVTYCLVNERNKIVNILATPNGTKEIVSKYLSTVDPVWTISEFNQLVHETMYQYKSLESLWDYVSKNLAS